MNIPKSQTKTTRAVCRHFSAKILKKQEHVILRELLITDHTSNTQSLLQSFIYSFKGFIVQETFIDIL
uniref:Uncharacterized protein n=1 Tax=Rhizophora mucronata TaxID=61149 RepID=A0A2P2P6D7_RHIMU